jgi:hypothetical protein
LRAISAVADRCCSTDYAIVAAMLLTSSIVVVMP